MGIRVHMLAKELGVENKDIINLCHSKGIVRITKHMQTVSEGEARMLRQEVTEIRSREAAKVAAAEAAAARAAAAPPAPPKAQEAPRTQEQQQPQAQAPAPSAPAPPAARPYTPPPQSSRPGSAPPRPMRPHAGGHPAPGHGGAVGRPKPAAFKPPRAPEPPLEKDRKTRGGRRDKVRPVPETEEHRRAKSKLKPLPGTPEVDKEELGMVFTDFTAGGTYSGTIAGAGVDYQRRSRQSRPFGRRGRKMGGGGPKAPAIPVPPSERKATLAFPVTVRDLSAAIGLKAGDIIRQLMENQVVVTINQPLPNDMVQMIALEHGWEVTVKEREDIEEQIEREATSDREDKLESRIPVVTLLGHVDHGKTSLLDKIRTANVAARETGGITQHIGAYHVETKNHKHITFLDTPGHEAFTAMRARGANCTDIVILVVAADDGVMPQTVEAISHAKAAGVPIVIALNKIDMPAADPARVKPQLANAGLELEEWGGDVPCCEVSAATGEGIDELLEMLLIVAELRDLKANPHKAATGTVLEANLTEGRGAVATVLIREGTLKVGDVILCGSAFGKVRSMHDDKGHVIQQAGPSIPVQISGINGVPEAGDQMITVDDLQKAREVADIRSHRQRVASLIERSHVTLENLFGKIAEGQAGEVRIVLKVDVMGSLGPLTDKLNKLSTDEVKMRIIHSGVGAVNESDVLLADASDAIIIAFRVLADARTRRIAEDKKVDLRFYQIIFQPIDDMRQALSGLLKPERREKIVGHATVKQVFKLSKGGNVAGCQVTDGAMENDAVVRVARNGIIILDGGKMQSLRRVKEDVKHVPVGTECGIKLHSFDDLKEGDVIEAYRVEEIARSL